MLIFVDIDETICYYEEKRDYKLAKPYYERIEKINNLYSNGNTIVYWTARGSVTQENWFEITYKQLTEWKCKFHELRMGKPAYDLFIDDKNINSDEYFKIINNIK
tara:strand:+ start:325 stop:639 length:315 start_codon:yes stop_codon:yes gene_type:complete